MEIAPPRSVGGARIHFGSPAADVLTRLVAPPYAVVTSRGGAERLAASGLLKSLSVPLALLALPPGLLTTRGLSSLRLPERPATVVAIGGGTALDAGKLICREKGGGRLIALPTSAGSGSEITATASLWDDGLKRSVEAPSLMPDHAVYDPELLRSAPRRVRLSAAWDAVSHALESLWSRRASPISDRLAARGLRILTGALGEGAAMDDSRLAEFQRGAALAAAAIAFTRTGIAHALSYEMTARHALSHGLSAGLFSVATAHLLSREASASADKIAHALGCRPEETAERLRAAWRISGAAAAARAEIDAASVLDALETLDPGRADLSLVRATEETVRRIRVVAASLLEERP